LSPDAHRNCRFGQWCHGTGAAALGLHPGFSEVLSEHERMHQCAAALLTAAASGNAVEVKGYERFLSAMKRLRLEIATLKGELETMLHSLDPLTGTPGRLGMLTKLRAEHALVQRNIHTCSVAMIDLDHFKSINDTFGHLAGDKVLIDTARFVMEHLRPYDGVFRYGGEEFLLCLPDTDAATARDVMERMREGLAALPHTINGKELRVTVSCGLAQLQAEIPVEQTIDHADKALYAAKSAGRNRTVVWQPSMSGVDA
jgi:diguanylate cyclase (GGDEF)-like protein